MGTAKPEIGKGESNPDETIVFEVRAKLVQLVPKKDDKGKDLESGEKEWKSFGIGVTKIWKNDKINKAGVRLYSGLRISLNCLITNGMTFTKLGGKQSSVRFMAVGDDGPVCVMLKTKPENLDKFHSTLEELAK